MMDVIGMIVNTITLAELLYNGIDDFIAADSDEESLVLRMQMSAATLGRFSKTFRQAAGVTLSADEKTTIIAACDLLKANIEKIQDIFVKIITEDAKWRRLGLRVAWVAYRKRQLESMAAQLRDWSGLFNEFMGSLSNSLQDRINASQDQEASGNSSSNQMTSFSKSCCSLAVAAEAMDIRQLRRDLESVHLESNEGVLRPAKYLETSVFIEYKSYDSGADNDRITYIEEQIGRLCNFLSLADPIATGILASSGYVADPQMLRFGLLMKIPQGYELFPQTGDQVGPVKLASVIGQRAPAFSNPNDNTSTHTSRPRLTQTLDARVSVASMIAVALYFLHSYGWVHENLRTSNILMLAEKGRTQPGPNSFAKPYLGRPFLTGFDGARSQDGIYSIGGYEAAASEADRFVSDLFQHPDRQGGPGRDTPRYLMNYDLYSLGVVLLEVGIWQRLQRKKTVWELREQKIENVEERHAMVREVLINLAQAELAEAMGQRYCDIVLKCLRFKREDPYDLSRFLHEIVWPLWHMKSCL